MKKIIYTLLISSCFITPSLKAQDAITHAVIAGDKGAAVAEARRAMFSAIKHNSFDEAQKVVQAIETTLYPITSPQYEKEFVPGIAALLIKALRLGKVEECKNIISSGVLPKDPQGKILSLAVAKGLEEGEWEMAKYLIASKTTIEKPVHSVDLGGALIDPRFFLHPSLTSETLPFLLEQGFLSAETLLSSCVSKGDFKKLKFLVEEMGLIDKTGSILSMVISPKYQEMFDYLVDNGFEDQEGLALETLNSELEGSKFSLISPEYRKKQEVHSDYVKKALTTNNLF